MEDSEKNKKDLKDNGIPEEKEYDAVQSQNADEAYRDSPLVDVFREDRLSDTRRVTIDELNAVKGEKRQRETAADEINIEERDYMPVRFRREGRFGCLGGIMYAVFIICVSVVLACAGWMAASDVLALNKDDITATVTIPKDIFSKVEKEVKDDEGKVTGTTTLDSADMDYVASALKDSGIIEYKWLFKLYAKVSNADTKIDPGTYQLSTRFDYRALVKNMQVGTEAMAVTRLTFPEGYTMAQIFDRLEENDICSADELYEAAASFNYNYSFLEGVETGSAERLEGFIFPNTYDFYQGEQATSVINKFLAALHYSITADNWKQCENLGISFREAVIIASMIEKEAANDEERPQIASVIYNRLKADMTLGIDSTILYVHPEFEGGAIPQEMLEEDSPYNTRIYKGLTPTPICNPGMASISAALKPAATNYYYYALDTATGTHRFFTNYNEFEAFTATQNYEE